jgi:hypothetical protein
VVAVATSRVSARWALGEPRWTLAAAGVLLLGLLVRLALGGAGVGDRSALVMTVLLAGVAWVAARLFGGPRMALVAVAAVVALMDLAALPNRGARDYDDLEAFYRTDQMLPVQLTVPQGVEQPAITLLVKPVFAGAAPRFGLAADVNGTTLQWTCAFEHGVVQQVALPVPPELARGQSTLNAQLHLSGSPSHDGDYLVVYASSRQGGFVIGLQPLAAVDPGTTRCTSA